MLSNQPKKNVEKMESHGNDKEDRLALLTKNFHKFLKRHASKPNLGSLVLKASKGKNSFRPLDFSNKKGVQYRECEGYGHIQFECASMRKNKVKDDDQYMD